MAKKERPGKDPAPKKDVPKRGPGPVPYTPKKDAEGGGTNIRPDKK